MRVVSSDILVPTFSAAVVEKAYSIEELTECIPLCKRRRRVKPDMPGLSGPEVEALYARGSAWLSGYDAG